MMQATSGFSKGLDKYREPLTRDGDEVPHPEISHPYLTRPAAEELRNLINMERLHLRVGDSHTILSHSISAFFPSCRLRSALAGASLSAQFRARKVSMCSGSKGVVPVSIVLAPEDSTRTNLVPMNLQHRERRPGD